MTRQWNGVHPREMCRQHLLGEHNEILKAAGGFLYHPHGLAITHGQIQDGNIDFSTATHRLDKLRAEMLRRGYNPTLTNMLDDVTARHGPCGDTDPDRNRRDLADRCPECRERMGREER